MEEVERKKELRSVTSFLLALGIVALAIVAAVFMVKNRRIAKQEDSPRVIPTVLVQEVWKSDFQVIIRTQAAVESARRTRLGAEVNGRVLEISPNLRRGGTVKFDEVLVTIDPADFRAALARATSSAAEAELSLAQETARVEQAALDWKRLGGGSNGNPLVLRKPQMEAAQALADAARAEQERARRDLERTQIRAPFDAGVREVSVEEGVVIAPGTAITTLFSIQDLEVRLPITLEDYGFLERDSENRPLGAIRLTAQLGGAMHEWTAEVARIDREIDPATLSGALIVKVINNPESEFPLPPVGLFVEAEIQGRTLNDVIEVPRRAIRESGDALVINSSDELEFRPLTIIRKTRDDAIVTAGLESGDRICLTRLGSPVIGMKVHPESEPLAPSENE